MTQKKMTLARFNNQYGPGLFLSSIVAGAIGVAVLKAPPAALAITVPTAQQAAIQSKTIIDEFKAGSVVFVCPSTGQTWEQSKAAIDIRYGDLRPTFSIEDVPSDVSVKDYMDGKRLADCRPQPRTGLAKGAHVGIG